MQIVDARGLSCPEPALMAQDAIEQFPNEPVRILVGTATQKVNVGGAAKCAHRAFTESRDGEDYVIDVQ